MTAFTKSCTARDLSFRALVQSAAVGGLTVCLRRVVEGIAFVQHQPGHGWKDFVLEPLLTSPCIKRSASKSTQPKDRDLPSHLVASASAKLVRLPYASTRNPRSSLSTSKTSHQFSSTSLISNSRAAK